MHAFEIDRSGLDNFNFEAVIKPIGDEVMARFATVDDAMSAASQMQARITADAEASGEHIPVSIRVGCHFGPVVKEWKPLRHYAIPGAVNWTLEGARYAWRMKAVSKATGPFRIEIDDPGLAEAERRALPALFDLSGAAPDWMDWSLVFAGMRRSTWAERPFYDTAYSAEDAEWATWALSQGHAIRYVPDAVVMHSENYTLRRLASRRFVVTPSTISSRTSCSRSVRASGSSLLRPAGRANSSRSFLARDGVSAGSPRPTAPRSANTKLSMRAMLQRVPRKVKEFNLIGYLEGTGESEAPTANARASYTVSRPLDAEDAEERAVSLY